MIRIDSNKCNKCGLCKKKCLFDSILINRDYPKIIKEKCVLCGSCAAVCPQKAVLMDTESTVSTEEISEYSGILVVMQIDRKNQMPKKVSYELLSEGRKLADRIGQKLSAICLCKSEPYGMKQELGAVGCEELLLSENSIFACYNNDIFTGIIASLIKKQRPSIVLFPATEDGRDLAPRVAGRLRVGLTADCTALDIDKENRFLQIRPTYGGNIIASIVTPIHRPQMASIRPNVFRVVPYDKKSLL
jgi:electron transfer flavoprotein alpha subunit